MLVKVQIPETVSLDFDSTGLGYGPGICSLTSLPGDSEAEQFIDHTADSNFCWD